MMKNPFTDRPKESFAMALQKPAGRGGVKSAQKARGIAVPGLSNQRGVKAMQRNSA